MSDLPDVHFGSGEAPLPTDWQDAPDPETDDELLPETPEDVVRMLGFDPAKEPEFDDMPLTEKGSKILSNMENEYGEKKGKSVFYASKNAGAIHGVDAAKLDALMEGCDRLDARLDALVRTRADAPVKSAAEARERALGWRQQAAREFNERDREMALHRAKQLEQRAKEMEAASTSRRDAGDAPGNGKEPYGDVKYADPGYQSDKKDRYPIDTEEHIRAAWNYIHKIRDEDKYSPEQRKEIEGRIVRAWESKIGGKPPEAEKK